MLDQSYYSKTDEIIEHYGKDARSLIPIMQDIQAEYRYLPGGAAHLCSRADWNYRGESVQCSNILREFFL